MLAMAASRLSPSDIWRLKDVKTKERSMLESWRDRRVSKGHGEPEESSDGRPETKEISGSWRVRKQEKAKGVDETEVYGDCMPAEWKLQKMYKQLKVDTNRFTTWLVESVYPCGQDLPPYITLSRMQVKGMSKPDRIMTYTATLTTHTDHAKYEILVNSITEIARRIQQVPPDILELLDRLIIERSEYSHWMSRKSTDTLSKFANDSHTYYIEVLKDVKTILAEYTAPERKTSSQTMSPISAGHASTPTRKNKPTLGKRKNRAISLQGPDGRKAVKTEPATSKLKQILREEVRQSTITQGQQHKEWRQMVADSCNNTADKRCTLVAKPMSYAAALRFAVAT